MFLQGDIVNKFEHVQGPGIFRILGVPVQWGPSWTSLNMYGGMVLYRGGGGECWGPVLGPPL